LIGLHDLMKSNSLGVSSIFLRLQPLRAVTLTGNNRERFHSH